MMKVKSNEVDDLRDADLDRMTARECFEYLSRGLEGGEVAILKAVAMTRAHERKKWQRSPSARLAVDWLLTRIGSWTSARWDQHLRDHVGDEATDRIIEDLGYKKLPAGEAPVLLP